MSAIRARISKAVAPFLVLVFGLAPTAASAQVFRAYLAIDGNDANPCTLAAPCRLLPAALTAVADGGEIWMLDSGNYNTGVVGITKTVTILAIPGALGSVVALGNNALSISGAGIDVTLRNLNIAAFPGSEGLYAGISVSGGVGSLTVQNCNIVSNNYGLRVFASGASQVTVIDSVFRDNSIHTEFLPNGTARIVGSKFVGGSYGVRAGSSISGTLAVSIARSSVSNATYGILATATHLNSTLRVSVADSLVDNNTQVGVLANAGATGAKALVSVSGSLITGSPFGLQSAGDGAKLVASANAVTNNTTGMATAVPAILESAGNNVVRLNNTDLSGVTGIGTQ